MTHWSVAQAGLNDDKKWRSKLLLDCPFKGNIVLFKKLFFLKLKHFFIIILFLAYFSSYTWFRIRITIRFKAGSGRIRSTGHIVTSSTKTRSHSETLARPGFLAEYPNKLSQLLRNESDLLPPAKLHPLFYGMFLINRNHTTRILIRPLKKPVYPNIGYSFFY